MISLKSRSNCSEITDDMTLSSTELIENLKELEWINKWLGGHSASLAGLNQLINNAESSLTIADFGCGGGDTIGFLEEKLKPLKPELTAVDGNKASLTYAKKQLQNKVTFIHSDFFDPNFDQTFDIIHSSLTAHHFSSDRIINFFQKMWAQCNVGFVVNDLHRHLLSYSGVKLLNGVIIKTDLGKHDGVNSVLRGFTKKELVYALQQAGVKNFSITWKWAFRWVVVAKKN